MVRLFLTFFILTFAVPAHAHDVSKLPPLNEAGVSKDEIFAWVPDAVAEIMTFGFHDHEMRLQNSARHFTREGWEKFIKGLEQSLLLESMKHNRQVVSTKATSPPTLISEGAENDTYQWKIEVLANAKFETESKQRLDKWLLTLIIVRSDEPQNEMGFAIKQWRVALQEPNKR